VSRIRAAQNSRLRGLLDCCNSHCCCGSWFPVAAPNLADDSCQATTIPSILQRLVQASGMHAASPLYCDDTLSSFLPAFCAFGFSSSRCALASTLPLFSCAFLCLPCPLALAYM
jgi:hypothetical protein